MTRSPRHERSLFEDRLAGFLNGARRWLLQKMGWVPARSGQGRPGKGPSLLAECSQESLIPVSARNPAEVGGVVPGSPVIKRVRAVAGRGDSGQAAPATVNQVAVRGEGEECVPQAGPCC